MTLNEIKEFYIYFPITLAFQKVVPIDDFHRSYLSEFLIQREGFFFIGDFIGGNRLRSRCRMLRGSLCRLHSRGKPLQCQVVPFSVTFPEEYQDKVIKQRKRDAFRGCEGFNEGEVVWRGVFENRELKSNFYRLRENMMSQRDLLQRILDSVSDGDAYKMLVRRERGILEMPIPRDFYGETIVRANIDKPQEFIREQKRLLSYELTIGSQKNPIFSEALREIEAFKI